MNWFVVADWIISKCCDQHRRFGSCHCVSGRKGRRYNPCERAAAVAESCKELGMGNTPQHALAGILAWVQAHRCRRRMCNHKGCAQTDQHLDWVREQHRKKAA